MRSTLPETSFRRLLFIWNLLVVTFREQHNAFGRNGSKSEQTSQVPRACPDLFGMCMDMFKDVSSILSWVKLMAMMRWSMELAAQAPTQERFDRWRTLKRNRRGYFPRCSYEQCREQASLPSNGNNCTHGRLLRIGFWGISHKRDKGTNI